MIKNTLYHSSPCFHLLAGCLNKAGLKIEWGLVKVAVQVIYRILNPLLWKKKCFELEKWRLSFCVDNS